MKLLKTKKIWSLYGWGSTALRLEPLNSVTDQAFQRDVKYERLNLIYSEPPLQYNKSLLYLPKNVCFELSKKMPTTM